MYWRDYLLDTQGLTTEQHGYYLLLIAYYWENGRLPPTAAERQRIVKMTPRKDGKCWKAIRSFWQTDGTHKRIDKERAKFEILSTKRKLAGMKGASQRWQMPMPIAMTPPLSFGMAIAPHNHNKIIKASILNREAAKMRPTDPGYAQALVNGTPDLAKLIEEQNRKRGIAPASSATALPSGAPPRPDATEPAKPNGKAPHRLTRAELDALYASRKPVSATEKAKDEDIPL